jgi:hypothetical protein
MREQWSKRNKGENKWTGGYSEFAWYQIECDETK